MPVSEAPASEAHPEGCDISLHVSIIWYQAEAMALGVGRGRLTQRAQEAGVAVGTRGRGLGASALFKIPPDSLTRTCSAHLSDQALRDGPVSSLNPALGRLWPKAGPAHWQH